MANPTPEQIAAIANQITQNTATAVAAIQNATVDVTPITTAVEAQTAALTPAN